MSPMLNSKCGVHSVAFASRGTKNEPCSMAKPITHAVTPNSIPPVPNWKPDLNEPCLADYSLPRCAIRTGARELPARVRSSDGRIGPAASSFPSASADESLFRWARNTSTWRNRTSQKPLRGVRLTGKDALIALRSVFLPMPVARVHPP